MPDTQVEQAHKHFYVIVRTDIPISQQLVQAVHAAHEAGIHLSEQYNNTSSVVICKVASEADLFKAESYLENKGIRVMMFYELDMGNQATALASEPVFGPDRKSFSRYKLWSNNNGQSQIYCLQGCEKFLPQ